MTKKEGYLNDIATVKQAIETDTITGDGCTSTVGIIDDWKNPLIVLMYMKSAYNDRINACPAARKAIKVLTPFWWLDTPIMDCDPVKRVNFIRDRKKEALEAVEAFKKFVEVFYTGEERE